MFDSAHVLWIRAFDLVTECFSIFSTPAKMVLLSLDLLWISGCEVGCFEGLPLILALIFGILWIFVPSKFSKMAMF